MPEIKFVSNAPQLEGTYPLNFYVETETTTGRPALCGRPGHIYALDLGTAQTAGVKAITYAGGFDTGNSHFGYVVNGTALQMISVDALSVLATASGSVGGSEIAAELIVGKNHVLVACGTGCQYSVKDETGPPYTPGAVTSISISGVSSFQSISYLDTYYLVAAKGTGRFYVSNVNDPTTFGATNWAECARYSDNIMKLYAWHDQIFIFGNNSIEIWRNAGATGGVPFRRVEGATILGVGLPYGGRYAVVGIGQHVYFMGFDKRVYRISGYGFEVIGTPVIHSLLRAVSAGTDIYFMSTLYKGHEWLIINAYGANVTLVYDITTGMWFRWSYSATSTLDAIPFVCSEILPYGPVFGATAEMTGTQDWLFTLSTTATQDVTGYSGGFTVKDIYRERVFPEIYSDEMISYHKLEVHGKPITNNALNFSYSDDGGANYTAVETVTNSDGIFRCWQLGASRRKTFKISTTFASASHEYYAAYVNATPGTP